MSAIHDSWSSDSFEDHITRATIALYETKIDSGATKYEKNHTPHFVSREHLRVVQRDGIFIPAPDRLIWGDGTEYIGAPGTQLMSLPMSGCVAMGSNDHTVRPDTDDVATYCRIIHFRRVNKLPAGMKLIAPGTLYEITDLFPQQNDGVLGIKDYATVNQKSGRVIPAVYLGRRNGSQAVAQRMQDYSHRSDVSLLAGLQYVDDAQHQWTITALQGTTKVTVGAYAENVKSLLYARELPLTPSGRKRPILHVVSAHRRRMQSGVEVDIRDFLRGTREIVMDDIKYKVNAPERLIREMLAKAA